MVNDRERAPFLRAVRLGEADSLFPVFVHDTFKFTALNGMNSSDIVLLSNSSTIESFYAH